MWERHLSNVAICFDKGVGENSWISFSDTREIEYTNKIFMFILNFYLDVF